VDYVSGNGNGLISTLCGTGNPGLSGDGYSATTATLNAPGAVAIDSLGNIFIADTNNHAIRELFLGTSPTLSPTPPPSPKPIGAPTQVPTAPLTTTQQNLNRISSSVYNAISNLLSSPVKIGNQYSLK